MKKGVLIYYFIALIVILVGCHEETPLESQSFSKSDVQLIVSKNFGQEEIYNKRLEINDQTSVMTLLQQNLDVETEYGGNFINAISGIKSQYTGFKKKKRIDWFYYVNGVLAQVGANDYDLKPQDVVLWDYHNWSNSPSSSSIIGAYPYNFINGYGDERYDLKISLTEKFKKEGNKLAKYLQENMGERVSIDTINNDGIKSLKRDDLNSIIIGEFNTIVQIDYIKDILRNREKLGLFFKIDDGIEALSYNNQESKLYKKGAVIASIPKAYGSGATLWIVAGNDEKSIKKALKILYETPIKIRGNFSVIVTEDTIESLPLFNP